MFYFLLFYKELFLKVLFFFLSNLMFSLTANVHILLIIPSTIHQRILRIISPKWLNLLRRLRFHHPRRLHLLIVIPRFPKLQRRVKPHLRSPFRVYQFCPIHDIRLTITVPLIEKVVPSLEYLQLVERACTGEVGRTATLAMPFIAQQPVCLFWNLSFHIGRILRRLVLLILLF